MGGNKFVVKLQQESDSWRQLRTPAAFHAAGFSHCGILRSETGPVEI